MTCLLQVSRSRILRRACVCVCVYTSPYQCTKRLSTSASPPTEEAPSTANKMTESHTPPGSILYQGPFASLTLRLKRISITTAVLSMTGVPLIILLKAWFIPGAEMDVQDTLAAADHLLNTNTSMDTTTPSSSFNVSKQVIVGATAVLAATGSTAALSYCFSPYVHTLEYYTQNSNSSSSLIQAKTRNIWAREVHTVFDMDRDVIPLSVLTSGKSPLTRPFCNFIAKGLPMYVHPELIHDAILREKLFGEKPTAMEVESETSSYPTTRQTLEEKQKKDDDFL